METSKLKEKNRETLKELLKAKLSYLYFLNAKYETDEVSVRQVLYQVSESVRYLEKRLLSGNIPKKHTEPHKEKLENYKTLQVALKSLINNEKQKTEVQPQINP